MDENTNGSDGRFSHYRAAFVGLVLGQIAGSNSTTIAKLYYFLHGRGKYTSDEIVELSLIVILLLTALGVTLGAIAMKSERRRSTSLQGLTSTLVALVVIFMNSLDHSLPSAIESSPGTDSTWFWERVYWLVGVLGLWLGGFSPLYMGRYDDVVQRAYGLLVVAAPMTLVGLLGGYLVEGVVAGTACTSGQSFWIARPYAVNAICGAYVGTAFANVWWPKLSHSTPWVWGWTVVVSALTVVYTGSYGLFLYPWTETIQSWRSFGAFGAWPLIVTLTVLPAYKLTRREHRADVGWPVSIRFWLLLPVAFAISFAVVAWLMGYVLLARNHGPECARLALFIGAHSVNGIMMGFTLLVMPLTIRCVRALKFA
ncbi:MAG: hypothetical protein OXF79_02920 [Chloroflexi bacterium]|nr:hypothetical protein [Chloroflexota bacterium]